MHGDEVIENEMLLKVSVMLKLNVVRNVFDGRHKLMVGCLNSSTINGIEELK